MLVKTEKILMKITESSHCIEGKEIEDTGNWKWEVRKLLVQTQEIIL